MISPRQLLHSIWRWLLRPDGFKAGVVTVGVLFGVYFGGGRVFQRGLEGIDARLIDWMFVWRAKAQGKAPTANRCVIVDIDDKSLAAIGQWPWPRTVVADLLRRICVDAPAVVGLDIVFAEPDRLSPRRFVEILARETGTRIELPADSLDNDVVLGDALAEGLPVVLGYLFVLEPDGTPIPEQAPFPDCNSTWVPSPPPDFVPPLLAAYRPLLNVPEIGESASTEGFFNAEAGNDAVVRQVPLFLQYDGRPFPSLVMEMYRRSIGEKTYKLLWGTDGMLGVRVGETFLPTTTKGMAMLNWRRERDSFPYVSAVDVLTGRTPPGTLRDKYVFVGTSAGGLHDLRSSPLAASVPGVEFHATLMDNILQGDLFRRDEFVERGIFTFGLLIGGLVLSAVLAYCPAAVGVSASILALFGSVWANYRFFFLANLHVGVTFPLLCIVLLILVVISANYLVEDRQKSYIRHAFAHYVSGRVVDRLLRDPRSLTLSGEQREMTIMFSDIRGFTGLSELFDAAGLAAFLNEYLTEMTDILLAEDGTLDKFIGDAVMAFWNAPSDQEDHARPGDRLRPAHAGAPGRTAGRLGGAGPAAGQDRRRHRHRPGQRRQHGQPRPLQLHRDGGHGEPGKPPGGADEDVRRGHPRLRTGAQRGQLAGQCPLCGPGAGEGTEGARPDLRAADQGDGGRGVDALAPGCRHLSGGRLRGLARGPCGAGEAVPRCSLRGVPRASGRIRDRPARELGRGVHAHQQVVLPLRQGRRREGPFRPFAPQDLYTVSNWVRRMISSCMPGERRTK